MISSGVLNTTTHQDLQKRKKFDQIALGRRNLSVAERPSMGKAYL
jgi:hypothetical protein